MQTCLYVGHFSSSGSLAAIQRWTWSLMLPVLDGRKREMMLYFHHNLVGNWLSSFPLHPLEFASCFRLNGTAFSKEHLKVHTDHLRRVGYTWSSHVNPFGFNLCDFCNEVSLGLWIIKSQILQGVLTLAHIFWCAGRILKLWGAVWLISVGPRLLKSV